MSAELKTTSGTKVKFVGLSRNKGVVWVDWEGRNTHILINDLDDESKVRVEKILEETLAEERKTQTSQKITK